MGRVLVGLLILRALGTDDSIFSIHHSRYGLRDEHGDQAF